MAKDFKANQIRTSKIVVSGSETGKPALLIYSASDATNFSGGIQSDMLTNVGSDVYLFVSGNNNSLVSGNRSRVTLFGGDVVVSGSFYAERVVAEVDHTTTANHYISGALIVRNDGSGDDINAKMNLGLGATAYGISTGEQTVDIGLAFPNQNGFSGISFDHLNGQVHTDGALIAEGNGRLLLSASDDMGFFAGGKTGVGFFGFEAGNGGGTAAFFTEGNTNPVIPPNANFYVSGAVGSHSAGDRAMAVFAGDTMVSGSLIVGNKTDNFLASPQIKLDGAGGYGLIGTVDNSNTWIRLNDSTAAENGVHAGEIMINTDGLSALSLTRGSAVFNDGGIGKDFRVESNNKPHAVFVSGNLDQVLILSGGAVASFDEAAAGDVAFYVSGSVDARGLQTRGVSVFGGDTVVSGGLYVGTLGTGQDVEFYGRDESAVGLAWEHSTSEHGLLRLGKDDHGVDFVAHGETAGKSLFWDQNNDRLQLVGELKTYGNSIFNSSGEDYDFRVESTNRESALLVDAGTDQVAVMTKGTSAANAYADNVDATGRAMPLDIGFFVSGAIGGRGTVSGEAAKGASVFGGDVHISGSITSDGTAIVAGTGAANRVTFWDSAGTVTGDGDFQYSSVNATIHNTGSVSTGLKSLADGDYSFSQGTFTTASNSYSHAEGEGSRSTGQSSHAEGYFTLAQGAQSHAEGYYTHALGNRSHAEGYFTTASNAGSHAEGYVTVATGLYAHAEGDSTLASGYGSHTEGQQTTASDSGAHAEGYATVASSPYAHAEGYLATATSHHAHAEGRQTLASGLGSHTEGYFTTASGNYSHAEGQYSVALGSYSHAGGTYTLASGSGQTVFGQYNKGENTTSLFAVGAGGHAGDRTDAFLVNSSSTGYSVHVGTGSNTKLIVDEAGSVGVGIENPLGKMHIKSGDSGQTAPSGFADDLIIEGSTSTGISILTPSNQVGRIYFGDNDNEQRAYVLYDHNLDVMKFSAANGNRMIIGEHGISGSLTSLIDGTSYLREGDNITIATGSSGAVTISATADSSITTVSGSTSIGSVSQIDFKEAGILNDIGGGVAALTGTIGNPEDGSYADGLFTSFTPGTTIGTAIDKINEVLKFLAPSPAANLRDINAKAIQGTTALLSFGATAAANPVGYNNAAVASGNTLASVDINESFSVATGSAGDLRLAVYNTATAVSGFINSNVLRSDYNGGSIINHASQSFGDADKGSLTLEVNGSTVATVDLTNASSGNGTPGNGTTSHFGSGDHTATGFIKLSQTGSARTQSDTEFPVFQHRTGEFTVSSNSQRKGYNFAKVKHTIGTTVHETNFVEWVYDQDGTNSSTPISANDSSFVFDSLAGGTNRFDLSGVKYAVTASGEYRSRIENYYRHVYSTNAISTSITNSTIGSTSPSTVPSINKGTGEDHTKAIHVTSSFDTNSASMLGTTVTGDISVTHPTKTGLSFAGSTSSGRFLIYSSSVTSTNVSETFDHEKYRVQSGSFVNQSDVTGGSFDWDSSIHMTASNAGHSDGLQFFGGALKSPLISLNSGDFRSPQDDAGANYFGANLTYNNQPDYSSQSGLRTFYRKVQNNTGAAIRDFRIQLNVGNTTIPEIVGEATVLDSQKIKVFARLPSEPASEWLDLGTQFQYHTTSNRSGGRANATLNTGGSPTNYFTFGTGSVANNEYFVVKIEADAALARDIGGISFTLPGVGGSPQSAPALDAIDSATSGVAGKLSFGASNGVGGFTNVAGGLNGESSARNTNDTFPLDDTGSSSKFYGILDGQTDITGTLNFDVSLNGNNYPADAFGSGHLGTIALSINGSTVHTKDLSDIYFGGNSKTNNSGFINISTAKNATGSNGIVADYTKFYRTGQFGINANQHQINGWNYARIVRTVGGSVVNTNYIEWVVDRDSDQLSLSNSVFSPFGEANQLYYQSGVKYFIQPTGSFRAQVNEAYSNVYSGDADALSITSVANLNSSTFTQVTGSGITNNQASSNQMPLPALDTSTSQPEQQPIFVTSSVVFNQGTSLPGLNELAGSSYAAAAKIEVKHPINGTQSSGNIYVGGNSSKKFLVFSASMGDGNLYTSERFGREDFRIISGNYTAQVNIGSGKWDSKKSINDASNVYYYDGLAVYNGHLVSPQTSSLPGSGDFRSHFDTATSDVISPLGNVDYSSLTNAASMSHRTYFRYFENNTTNNVLRIGVTLFGDATIVGKSGALSGSLGLNNNIHVEGKVPGKTGWLDLGRDTLGSGNTSDGDGGRVTGDVTVDASGALTTFTFNGQTLDGTGTGPDKVVLKITAHKDWTGYVNRLDVNHSV